MKLKQLYTPKKEKMRVAAFMSGTGSNLRKIIEKQKEGGYEVAIIFTDTADESKCKAKKIAEEFGIAYYCSDIREFYARKGADRKDLETRKDYDRETAKLLTENMIDVVALCGYMSIVTGEVCNNFLTINVHPADLRVIDSEGRRKYAGCMGAGCVKKVIESNGKELRSSTHVVTGEVDGGPVLMVSEAIKTDNSDEKALLEKLKQQGDWKIYPETLKKLADGRLWEGDGMVIDIAEEKQLLRQKMKELRERLSDKEVKGKSTAIAERLRRQKEYEAAKKVMFYIGVNKEVSTEQAIKNALADGKEIAVPVTDTEKGKIIAAELKAAEKMKLGAYGIPEPADVREVEGVELVVVPGIAFDEEGNRIGYGLGYYDKFLRETKAARICLAYELQIVDKIWADSHDARLDKIITEERTIEVVER